MPPRRRHLSSSDSSSSPTRSPAGSPPRQASRGGTPPLPPRTGEDEDLLLLDVFEEIVRLMPSAKGLRTMPESAPEAPWPSTSSSTQRPRLTLAWTSLMSKALEVVERKVSELPFDKPFKYRPVTEKRRRAYSVEEGRSKGGYLDVNARVLQDIAPDAAVARNISANVSWSLQDLIGLEQSTSYMSEIQNFVSWLVGGMVRRLREKSPQAFDSDQMLQRMSHSLTTAVGHLASETLSLRALAVIRRREHALTFFPRSFSQEDRHALRTSPLAAGSLFNDSLLQEIEERSTCRSSRMAMERLAYGPSTSSRNRDQGRVQPRQETP